MKLKNSFIELEKLRIKLGASKTNYNFSDINTINSKKYEVSKTNQQKQKQSQILKK